MKEIITAKFKELYKEEPTIIIRSPGRINIIGEHTDYNEGFVLPAAIDKAVYFAISLREDDCINLYAIDFLENFTSSIADVQKSDLQWPDYILGVVNELQKANYTVKGFNAVIASDLPIGAGLSSSAALECATAFALNNLLQLHIEKLNLLKHAQLAEHNFAGVMCGIMDQFASTMGKENHCIKLDCKTMEYEYIPLDLKGYTIVLLNTNVKHSLASSAYNTRRQECEQAVEWLKEKYAAINSLRYVTLQMLEEIVLPKDKTIYDRSSFVVAEINRVHAACKNLQEGNIKALGQKMFETHFGLSKLYEVSCKELDFLVDAVVDNNAVIGARMMGGGFGGCTINIVAENAVDIFIEKISIIYEKEMGKKLTAYVVNTAEGTSLI
jgi:galactokinase